MLAPKQITRVGLIIGLISLISLIPAFLFADAWGDLRWMPAIGLGLAALLFMASIVRGAYLTAQRRVEMVDMLNDCYQGNESQSSVGDRP